jgi:hypothetical protein
VKIQNINTNKHTINNKKIIAITKTISDDKYLVCFEKDSLGEGCPNEDTICSKKHKIYYKGLMIEANSFINNINGVYKVDYNKEVLYNVLMKHHSKIIVNNMLCETLDPENIIAKLYTNNFADTYKDKQKKITSNLPIKRVKKTFAISYL